LLIIYASFVFELFNQLGLFVEKEKKIQREIQMKNNIFYVDGSKLNFLTPKKLIPIPLEPAQSDSFDISCLLKLRKSLKLITNEEGQIKSSELLDLFADLHLTNQIFINLPNTWISNKAEYYQKLINKFQETKSNTVKFNVIFLFILLESKIVPTNSDIDLIKEEVEKQPLITWDLFKNVQWYFFNNFESKGKSE
jgi:hypothetical protein